ncbi:Phage holin family Hol44, holin superfamily V [Paenibacillus sp. UNCCL117]|uniref:phage holin family protein n=1 Tax=unclassified Paenibacillus TaxID=185978 RepID=UPI00088CB42E|nr:MULTISPECIES: phage holin family protein [unclassified Paenibacillus]SDC70539.1 Phage holin family Hol44, holin superfamily V [Paenibacillus sp. cl123]SFW24224.1 Phage holin family Hol44, holin superfamily V [Paenibacillus sp. UNCCL117]
MTIEDIGQLVDPKLLIVVAACWALGYVLKQTPRVPNWSVVYLVSVFALSVVYWMFGLTAEATVQGILCGAAAVYGHQLVKQAGNASDGGSKDAL